MSLREQSPRYSQNTVCKLDSSLQLFKFCFKRLVTEMNKLISEAIVAAYKAVVVTIKGQAFVIDPANGDRQALNEGALLEEGRLVKVGDEGQVVLYLTEQDKTIEVSQDQTLMLDSDILSQINVEKQGQTEALVKTMVRLSD